MAKQNTKLGIVLMLVAGVIFAISDGVSRYLVQHYSPMFILTLRYWFFGAFVLLMAWRSPQGFGAIARTEQPVLQIFRGILLAG